MTIATFTGSLATIIEQGVLERDLLESIRPALLWNAVVQQRLHPSGMGETVSLTREGLIAPSTAANALLATGMSVPNSATASMEQFSYTLNSYAISLNIPVPDSMLAAANVFQPRLNSLGFSGLQTINRIRRDTAFAAYGGGNSFATAAGVTSTALVVADATGFETTVVNGVVTVVSSTNPGTLTIAGVTRTYTAVNLGTNTITLSSAQSWSQYDAVVRDDASPIYRQGSRATDRLIVAGDTSTMATFRAAAAGLRGQNVPGINGLPGGDYMCFIDSDVENDLMSDSEFRTAVNGGGLAPSIESGILGRYGGIIFVRQPKSESKIIANLAPYQTTIHRSLMVGGGGAVIEAYKPEIELLSHGQPFVSGSHFRMQMTDGLAMVIQAPTDALGRQVKASWVGNFGWCAPSDINNGTGSSVRYKRAAVIHTAGPA